MWLHINFSFRNEIIIQVFWISQPHLFDFITTVLLYVQRIVGIRKILIYSIIFCGLFFFREYGLNRVSSTLSCNWFDLACLEFIFFPKREFIFWLALFRFLLLLFLRYRTYTLDNRLCWAKVVETISHVGILSSSQRVDPSQALIPIIFKEYNTGSIMKKIVEAVIIFTY